MFTHQISSKLSTNSLPQNLFFTIEQVFLQNKNTVLPEKKDIERVYEPNDRRIQFG